MPLRRVIGDDSQLYDSRIVRRIYDIQVLGISAVRNYRAQFKSLLSKETPAQVIERLKIKVEQLEKTDQKR